MILPGNAPESVAAAVRALRAGALLGLPTETVYGLAADAENEDAAALVFSTKGRPPDHPLIVHVRAADEGAHFALDLPDFAARLVHAFWPGPLTVILPRRAGVATVAAGGNATIALRCPAHPVARAVLAACAEVGIRGLAAPSANRFGRVSPTTAQHVEAEFGPELLTLDGGPCSVGIESTIVDCTRGVPVLLRPGWIDRGMLAAACGQAVHRPEEMAAPSPKASGTLPAHYAPRARLRLAAAAELQRVLDTSSASAGVTAVWARSVLRPVPGALLWRMPADAAGAAHALFAVLHALDAAGATTVWVETPPLTDAWEGVRDRLQRAAAAH